MNTFFFVDVTTVIERNNLFLLNFGINNQIQLYF